MNDVTWYGIQILPTSMTPANNLASLTIDFTSSVNSLAPPARLSPSPSLDPVLAALPPGSGDLAAAGGEGGSALLISSLVDVS
jgi:hypothetical protein